MRASPIWLRVGAQIALTLLVLCGTAQGRRHHGRHTKVSDKAKKDAPHSQPVPAPPPAQQVLAPAPEPPNPTRLEVSLLSPRDGAEFNTPEILVKAAVRVPPGESLLGIRAL